MDSMQSKRILNSLSSFVLVQNFTYNCGKKKNFKGDNFASQHNEHTRVVTYIILTKCSASITMTKNLNISNDQLLT